MITEADLISRPIPLDGDGPGCGAHDDPSCLCDVDLSLSPWDGTIAEDWTDRGQGIMNLAHADAPDPDRYPGGYLATVSSVAEFVGLLVPANHEARSRLGARRRLGTRLIIEGHDDATIAKACDTSPFYVRQWRAGRGRAY